MPTKTTRLEAVNTILSSGGEGPVNSLSDNAGVNTKLAEQILDETLKNVQTAGWWFNTRRNVEFEVNDDGEIPIPANVIRLDFPYFESEEIYKYTIRSNLLYDAVLDATNEFTDSVTASRVVYLLEWDDIPEAARQYITRKAARIYVDRHVSDPNQARIARQDEAEAMILLQREDISTSNSRIFGPDFHWIVDRGKPLDWIR